MSLSKILASLLTTLAVTLTALAPAQAAPVSGQGLWETTLQARDLDGNGMTDAFYDTILNITWLRNANVNGRMNWDDANTWANNLTFGGYSDWRLPTMLDNGVYSTTSGCDWSLPGFTNCGYNVKTSTSEMATLWYDELGNKAYCDPSGPNGYGWCTEQAGWGLSNTGDFENVPVGSYWLGTEYAPYTDDAWLFDNWQGSQNPDGKYLSGLFAMAVRPGDVAGPASQVPEPESLLLALTALAGLGLVRRRQTLGASRL